MVTKRVPKPVHQLTSAQFDAMFPIGNEDACKAYLKARRWPDGVHCLRCGNPGVYELKTRKWHWQCEQCTDDGYRFSIIAGTIFENTNKPLRDWFKVAHLMLTSKKGMSARQLYRYMGFGSLKTAWYMAHRIRTALVEMDMGKLGGIVEVDETWVGGKDQNAVVFTERCSRIADEPIAIQVGNECGVQLVQTDEFAEGWNLRGELTEQLSQGVRLDIQLGHAGTFAWNAKKLNMHSVRAPK